MGNDRKYFYFTFSIHCEIYLFDVLSNQFSFLLWEEARIVSPSSGSATGTSLIQRPSQRRVRGVPIHVIAPTKYDRPRMPLVSYAPCISSRTDPVDALSKITKSKTEFQMNSSTSE